MSGGTGQAEGGAIGEGHLLGELGEPDCGGDGDVLGEGPVLEVGLGHDPEHPVAHRVVGDAGPEGVDDTGEILAEDQRVAVLHVGLGQTGGHGQVETVHRGGVYANEDLALGRGGNVKLGEYRRRVGIGQGKGAHRDLHQRVSNWSSDTTP